MDTNDLAFLGMVLITGVLLVLLFVRDRQYIAHKRQTQSLQEQLDTLRNEMPSLS